MAVAREGESWQAVAVAGAAPAAIVAAQVAGEQRNLRARPPARRTRHIDDAPLHALARSSDENSVRAAASIACSIQRRPCR